MRKFTALTSPNTQNPPPVVCSNKDTRVRASSIRGDSPVAPSLLRRLSSRITPSSLPKFPGPKPTAALALIALASIVALALLGDVRSAGAQTLPTPTPTPSAGASQPDVIFVDGIDAFPDIDQHTGNVPHVPQSDIYNLNNQQNSGPTFTFNTSPSDCSQECQDLYRAVFADIHAFAQNRFGVSADTNDLQIIIEPQLIGAFGNYSPNQHKIWIDHQNGRDGSGVARHVLAHEYFHALHVPHNSIDLRGTPLWFIEGSAEYFTFIWLTQTGVVNHTYNDQRNRTIGVISGNIPPLRSDNGDDVQYRLGFLAIDYLIAHTSESAVVSSFTAANWLDRHPWLWGFGGRFQSVFGISLDSFYDDFAAYRRAGFPYPGAPFAPTFTFNTSPAECSQECQDAYRAVFADIHAFSQDRFGVSVDTSDLRITIEPQLDSCGEFQPWSGIRIDHRSFCRWPSREHVSSEALAHEYFHELQTPYILDRVGILLGTPKWFTEGSAEIFKVRWMEQYSAIRHDFTYDQERNRIIERLAKKQNLPPLRSDDGVDVQYELGFLAIDYLISQTSQGENKVATFFTGLSRGQGGFPRRFSEVFGMSLNDFYDDFAAHRACGFPQPGAPCGRIVFSSFRDGKSAIYAMNADGSNQTRLTNHPGNDHDPVWSPDGQRIAFSSNRDDDGGNLGEPAYEIYVMNADGTGVSRLTNAARNARWPAWSPDGKRIAFSADNGYLYKIHVMNADGTNDSQLTSGHMDLYPAWSPDVKRIAFSSRRYEASGIYVINADGSNLTRLTHASDRIIPAEGLDWSPDGKRIAFSLSLGIYVINADGSNQTRLTDGNDPAWSPDGQRIAFSSDRDIYVMNADGSNQTRLTNHPGNDIRPDWTSTTSGPITPPTGGNIANRVAHLERQVAALQSEASAQQKRIDRLDGLLTTLQYHVYRLAARVAALESAAPQPRAN